MQAPFKVIVCDGAKVANKVAEGIGSVGSTERQTTRSEDTSTRVARTQPPAAVVRAVTPPVRQAIRVVEDETLRDLEPVPCHKRHIARRVWVRRRLHHVGRARGIDLVPVPALRQAVRRVRACAYIIYNHGSAEELMR